MPRQPRIDLPGIPQHVVQRGNDRDETSRLDPYRSWVAAAVSAEELELVRLRLQRQHAMGTDRFRAMIEDQLNRRAGPAKIGRPRKPVQDECESAL